MGLGAGGVGREASEPWRGARQQRGRGQSAEIPHRGSVLTRTHQPETLVCLSTGGGGGWELKLGLQRSDPRERTGVSCVETA